jgi:hypothetical protein
MDGEFFGCAAGWPFYVASGIVLVRAMQTIAVGSF